MVKRNKKQVIADANAVRTKLGLFQHCYNNLVEASKEITEAFYNDHITTAQYDAYTGKLDALHAPLMAVGSDLTLVNTISDQAHLLKCEVLNLVLASKNAKEGWHKRDDGSFYHGMSYVAEHLQ